MAGMHRLVSSGVIALASGITLAQSPARAPQIWGDKDLADLTLAVAAINAWNRLSIAARLRPGTYQPAEATAGATK